MLKKINRGYIYKNTVFEFENWKCNLKNVSSNFQLFSDDEKIFHQKHIIYIYSKNIAPFSNNIGIMVRFEM